jgi:hypothetical protein
MTGMPDGGGYLGDESEAPRALMRASLWVRVVSAVVLAALGVVVAFGAPAVGITLTVVATAFAVGMFLAGRSRNGPASPRRPQ